MSSRPVLRPASPDFRRSAKNVFQIWHENGKRVPFRVQKLNWAKESYFSVVRVEISPKQTDYFENTGDMYGQAFGFFYYKGKQTTKGEPVELRNSGVYKWRLLHGENETDR